MTPDFRLRVEYQKSDRGAFLSHLEVIRALERMVRRAKLPFAITQGFNPHMKIAFGPALGVGTAARSEHFDITLADFIDPDDALNRMKEVASEVLMPMRCGYISPRDPSLSAVVTILQYQIVVEGKVTIKTDIPEHFDIEQKGKTKTHHALKVLPEGSVVTQVDDIAIVKFTVRATPEGTLRPDSFMKYLLGADYDAPTTRINYERIATFIEDEKGSWNEPLK
jgi:radical SAM-linked protein